MGSYHGTILVADDDSAILELISMSLEDAGYHVLKAKDGMEALRVAAEFPDPIALLLTDVVMPRMNGPELVRNLTAGRPLTKVLYMSGYMDQAVVHQHVLSHDLPILPKPFSMETMIQKVEESLHQT